MTTIEMRQDGIERQDLGGGDSELGEIMPMQPAEEVEWPQREDLGADGVQRQNLPFEPQAPDEERIVEGKRSFG